VLPLLAKKEVVNGYNFIPCDALQAVLRIGGPKAVPVMEKFVFSKGSGVARARAIGALAKIGGDKIVETLLRAVDTFTKDWGTRNCLARALGKIGGEKVWPGLEKLSQHGFYPVRREVARALAGPKLDREKALAMLVKLLAYKKGGHEEQVRCAAAKSLGQIGGPKVRAILLAHLPKELHRHPRGDIISALEKNYPDDEEVKKAIAKKQ